MEITMYDTLLQLPLFQGLCKNDFTNIIGKVKLHFRKYNADDIIVEQGEPCTQLIFLLNGEIISQATDDQHSYSLFETFGSPFVIEPYSLFGMQTKYTATYKARTAINVVTIDKSFVLSELNNYEIFRLNYLNILSNRAQVAYEKLWDSHAGSIQEKILNFLQLRCMKPDGEKILKIKMEDLAAMIDETRINVSKALNDMQEKGLIQLNRKEISIPALEKLAEDIQ
jgi:CRP-like cAMP-binding protein